MPVPPCHGLLVVDKPGGITSRAALDRAARWFPRGTRLGHAGTLDPLATGVLVLCAGAATRLVEFVQDMSKTYRTELLLGATSDTDDADGTITPVPAAVVPDRQAIEQTLAEFVGEIEQLPSAYSAAKVTGRRAHELARRGQPVHLEPRAVHIHAIDILDYCYPHLKLEVRCGKGTYIRALARDLGGRLQCGALVQELRRTQVGPFRAADSLSLGADTQSALGALQPMTAAVAELPKITASARQLEQLRRGQAIPWESGAPDDQPIAVLDGAQNLVPDVRSDPAGKGLQPQKVFLA